MQTPTSPTGNQETLVRFPKLNRRLQAALIDSSILCLVIGFGSVAVSQLPLAGYWKTALVVTAVLVLEPGLVTFRGATIGHCLRGLKVRDISVDKKVGFHRALARLFLKTLQGWLSLLTFLVTPKRQSIHDLATASIVVLRHPERLPASQSSAEQDHYDSNYLYPSKFRRSLVGIAYFAVLMAILMALLALALLGLPLLDSWMYSSDCSDGGQCMLYGELVTTPISILWVLSLIALVYLAASGRLYGARRQAKTQNPNQNM